MAEKICSYCMSSRGLSFYAKNARASDGICSKCKVCQKAYNDSHKEQKRQNGIAYRAANAARVKVNKKAWAEQNKDKKRATNKAWAQANPEKAKDSIYRHRLMHPEKANESTRKWRAANPEKASAHSKAWREANLARSNAITAHYRASKIMATPSWANAEKIRDFYLTADALGMWTGVWYHVDHIVPLRGKTVRGLHVEDNLQLLTEAENRKKNARWWPQMPEGR